MMKQLLKNLVEITTHREHSRLALSVISALYDLTKISQVRVLEIFTMRDELYVQEKILLKEGHLSTISENTHDDPKEPLSHYPAIQACMRDHKTEHAETTADGVHMLWLPVWLHGKINTVLEIRHSHAYDAATMEIINGVFQVYCNYESLLDYSSTVKPSMTSFPVRCSRLLRMKRIRWTAMSAAIPKRSRRTGWQWSILTTSSRSMTSMVTCMVMKY
jgi:hypothetical protein